MAKTVLAFMAHPDDVEFKCAGTLARLKQEAGCRIVIATATSGDCGSVQYPPQEIARIRNQEAKQSAAILDADYYCAGSVDLLIVYNENTIRRFTEVVRKAQPDIVITAPPADYLIDHEMTSHLVRTACFAAPAPNFLTYDIDPAKPIPAVPHLYYCDAVDHKDIHGQPFQSTFVVDITAVQPIKEKMLACHASQRDWLRAHHGIDEYLDMMHRADETNGRLINRPAGEAFRMHAGHGYPQDNIITTLLKT
ncbi:MAG: PIG-L family deacetylase [Phycisphaerae bacterium]|nr:PIG-L family deacetylase [Phycisphaerae bacterium]